MSDTYDWISGFNIGEARTNNPLPADYNIYLHGDGQSFRGFVRNDFSAADHYRNGDGWKIHLSIDPQDLSRAWDKVISPVLLDAKVGAAKFAVGDNLTGMADPANSQAGKVITIYGSGNRSWDEIARDLETGLAREGIKPGPAQIAGDRMVNGSQYIGYRNERAFGALAAYGDKYGYLGADRIRAAVRDGVVTPGMEYNPAGQPDSLQNIDFSRDPDVARARGPVAHDVPLEAPAAKPAKQGFFGRLFGDKTHQPQSTMPEQPSISTSAMEERASVPAAWENYQSGAFGESMRFSEPFPRDYGIHKDSKSAAMMRFESEMQTKGVNVQWGFKGEHAYAYVPATDGASTHQLNQLIRPPQAPERTNPSSAVSNAAASVQADLQTTLGEQNVLNVERVNGGYRVEVPPTYSRNELARAGIDPTGLQRQSPQYGNHSILIPEDRLPASIARDARVFDALDRAGISDVASNAYRVGQNGRATGYVIDVPETYSRQNLAAAGIDTSRIPSSAREDLGNGLHRITIPVEATLEVGSVASVVPQQQQMQQQQQHSRLNMTDEERETLRNSQMERQRAMLAETLAAQPAAPEPVTAVRDTIMHPMQMQQQVGVVGEPNPALRAQQQAAQEAMLAGKPAPEPLERRDSNSRGAALRGESPQPPMASTASEGWDYGAKPGEFTDKFGRPLRTNPRTGAMVDEVQASRDLWADRNQQMDELKARQAAANEPPVAKPQAAAPEPAPAERLRPRPSSPEAIEAIHRTYGDRADLGHAPLNAEPAPQSLPASNTRGTSASLDTPHASKPANVTEAVVAGTGTVELRPASSAKLATAERFVPNAILAQNDNIGRGATSATVPTGERNATVDRVVAKPAAAPLPVATNDTVAFSPKAPAPEAHTPIVTTEAHARAGGILGAGIAAYSLAESLRSGGTPNQDKLTTATQVTGVGSAGAGVVQSGANVLRTAGITSEALATTEAVAGKAGVVGAVGVGVLMTAHGISTGNKEEVAAGIGGTGGAIAGAEAGAVLGAEIGMGIGVWFGGIGAAPAGVIGSVVGGVVGGIAGSKFGTSIAHTAMAGYDTLRAELKRDHSALGVVAALNHAADHVPAIHDFHAAQRTIAHAAQTFVTDMKKDHSLKGVAHAANHAASEILHKAETTAMHRAKAVAHIASDAAHGVADTARSAWHSATSWLGFGGDDHKPTAHPVAHPHAAAKPAAPAKPAADHTHDHAAPHPGPIPNAKGHGQSTHR